MKPQDVLCRALVMLLLGGPAADAAEVEQREVLQVSPLAGFQHHAGLALFALMNVGDRLTLRRESDNPYDAKAVRVEWHGTQIGYAPRADNVDLARLMDRGTLVEARILHLQQSRDPWKRVLIEIYLVPTK
ncbi:MAG: HIRAN domain-containing protein [Pseudomonadota bacterium]|nr:HIRAN domain-containing protein [Pseudomonadota bacterium]